MFREYLKSLSSSLVILESVMLNFSMSLNYIVRCHKNMLTSKKRVYIEVYVNDVP